MDKIKKFLQKLSKKELDIVVKIIVRVESGEYENLDIKKLTGYKNIFRVRVGKIRILFVRSKNDFNIISIERRSDKTYK